MAKLVTMGDVGKALGLSTVSVSKALAGKDGVSEVTRQMIIDKAQEMGYVMPSASRVRNGDHLVIGVVIASRFFDTNTFYNKLYCDFVNHCSSDGNSVMLEIVSAESEHDLVAPRFVTEKQVDGVVFMGELRKEYILKVTERKIPYLFVDFFNDELEGDVVIGDNVHGGYMMTREIIRSGKKSVGFVGSISQTSSIMDRFLGMIKAVQRLGGITRQEWVIEDRDAEGRLIPLALPEELPEGFVCSCDAVASTLIQQLQEKGYRVPEDIAVTGYDDFGFSTMGKPFLTTYQVDTTAMARAACSQIKKIISKKKWSKDSVVVEGKLIRRDSV